LQKLEGDNAFEGNKLGHRLPVPNSRFHRVVESEDGHNSNDGGQSRNDSDPDVSEVEFIGGCAIRPRPFGNFGDEEENNLDDGELEDT
jgi:hypothetical protein